MACVRTVRLGVVPAGAVDSGGGGEAEVVDEDRAFRPERGAELAAGFVEGRSVAPPLAVWESRTTIDGSGLRPALMRAARRSRSMAAAQTPLARQRRNCCQKAPQGPNSAGR